jgi:hypothetical protein
MGSAEVVTKQPMQNFMAFSIQHAQALRHAKGDLNVG